MRLDLSRPDWVFCVLWTICFSASLLFPEIIGGDFSSVFAFLLLFNIVSFFVVYRLFAVLYGRVQVPREQLVSDYDVNKLGKFIRIIFIVWLILYLLTIQLSGGLPIIWIITGDSRTYVDFGVPTLSGFLNMIRGFIFAGCVLLYTKKGYANKKYLGLLVILLLASIAEMARGNVIVLLLHGVAMWLITHPLRLKSFFHVVWVFFVFILAFGLMGDIRNEGGADGVLDLVDDESVFKVLPSGFLWFYLYLVTPVINVGYAISEGIEPLFYPFFSIQSLLPTVLRDFVFEPNVYPIALKTEAFNATSFYGPLLADFGVIWTAIIILMLQTVVAYLHVRAVRGSIFHLLIFPAFYMSVVLSVFYMFFLSLVTVMYPLMSVAYQLYRQRPRKGQR